MTRFHIIEKKTGTEMQALSKKNGEGPMLSCRISHAKRVVCYTRQIKWQAGILLGAGVY